jgi:hypothetical protein
MAKVTLILEDVQAEDGQQSITMSGDFDQPGKSYDEMVADPTKAVDFGLKMMAMVCEEAKSFKGNMVDEFGTELTLEKVNK